MLNFIFSCTLTSYTHSKKEHLLQQLIEETDSLSYNLYPHIFFTAKQPGWVLKIRPDHDTRFSCGSCCVSPVFSRYGSRVYQPSFPCQVSLFSRCLLLTMSCWPCACSGCSSSKPFSLPSSSQILSILFKPHHAQKNGHSSHLQSSWGIENANSLSLFQLGLSLL